MADMYNPASPTSGDYQQESLGKINQILYDSQNGTKPLVTTGSTTAPTVTATKTAITAAVSGSIPAGFISAQIRVVGGAVIDGMTFADTESIYYSPGSKLHAAIVFTLGGGQSLTGYYET